MSERLEYYFDNTWYARDYGDWWAPTGGMLPTGTTQNGQRYYESRYQPSWSSIRAKNQDYYIASAEMCMARGDSYADGKGVYCCLCDSSNNVISGSCYGTTSSTGYYYIDVTDIVSVILDTNAYFVLYNHANNSYHEVYGHNGTYPPSLIIVWERREPEMTQPTPPSNVKIKEALFESGITVTYTPGQDGIGNAIDMNVFCFEYSNDGSSWTEIYRYYADKTSSTSQYITTDSVIQAVPRGAYLRCRMSAHGNGGWWSEYSGYSNSSKRNRLPSNLTILYPTGQGCTYSPKARFGLRINSDPDGKLMSAEISGSNGVLSDTVNNNTAFWSRTGRFVSGTELKCLGFTLKNGLNQFDYSSNDGLASCNKASISLRYTEPIFTDNVLVAGQTSIKASHITELRTMINNVRLNYGLTEFTFTDSDLTNKIISAIHISELRSALEAVVNQINSVDIASTKNDISMPEWTDSALVPNQTPIKAAHIREIRELIQQL